MKQKIKKFFLNIYKWLITNLKDKITLFIFIGVVFILTLPITGGYFIYFITKNGWFLGIATTYLAFWLGPVTPFWPLALAITIALRKIYKKIFKK